MPKEVARIFLKVTDIRAEKLQNLTIQQAKKEGAFHACSMCYYWHDHCGQAVTMAKDCKIDRISPEFPKLWDSTIKKQDLDRFDWEANPWVWVIEFERCEIMKEESDIADFEQRELIDDK